MNGVKESEIKAVNVENTVRKVTGDDRRTNYDGNEIPASRLTQDPQLDQ